ncbi:MAG: MotA/TolQ/ExbB proton channel family protein [Burkholderiaceae bacterium]
MKLTNKLRTLGFAWIFTALVGGALLPQLASAQTTPAAADASAAPAAIAPPAPVDTSAAKTDVSATQALTETVENPYGLEALWKTGDFIAKSVLVLLVIMSMGSWYIMITKLFEQGKLIKQAKAANKTFWSAPSVPQGISTLKAGSPFKFIAESGMQATERHEGLLGGIDLNTWVTMSIQRAVENVQNRLQDGLAFLATVGSTAPFVGLFGTVWGIYHALTAIGIAGQASIDKVAGPVGEALIMTAMGLAVAVPAVLGYNWLVRRNKTSMERVRAFGSDIHSVLLGGGTTRVVPASVGASTPTRAAAVSRVS